jgi:hypothetical protein
MLEICALFERGALLEAFVGWKEKARLSFR